MTNKKKKYYKGHFDDFLLSLQNINAHHFFIQKREKALLNKFHNMQDVNDFFSSISFYADNPIAGNKEIFPPITLDNRDKYIEQVLHLNNRQKQYLLVEAYENLEKYLKNILGCEENNEEKYILKKAKSDICGLTEKLQSNKTGINLNFRIELIKQFRNIIVHNNGFTTSKDFIDKALKNSGISDSGDKGKECLDFINYFLSAKDNKNIMLDFVNNGLIKYDKFDCLLRNIASYAMIVNYKKTRKKTK